MPLPEPVNGETREDFMSRCISDSEIQGEFEGDQRIAVCSNIWDTAKDVAKDVTDFPDNGDNLAVSLKNSNYAQFDWAFTKQIKDTNPEVWDLGGNTRGNEAFELWTTARQKSSEDLTDTEKDWIHEREAWAARHFDNKLAAGVMALAKWGVVGSIGEDEMKDILREEIKKEDEKRMDKLQKALQDKQKKQIDITTKMMDEEKRIIRFTASTEAYDRDDDRLFVNGWKFDDYDKNPVFLYMHDYEIPAVGKCVSHFIDGLEKRLVMDIQFPTIEEMCSDKAMVHEHALFADMLYNMYKNGYMSAVSVGFMGYKGDYNDKGGIDFMEQGLLELSAVTVPANPEAVAEVTKNFTPEDKKGVIDIMSSFDIDVEAIEDMTKTLMDVLGNKEEKTFDPMGNPSAWDIECKLDNALGENKYVANLYPVNYPSGHCAVYDWKENVATMHSYTYEDGEVMIGLGTEVEWESQYTIKAKSYVSEKVGATISAKNRDKINSAIGKMEGAVETLKGVMDGLEEDDKGFNPEGNNDEIAAMLGGIDISFD